MRSATARKHQAAPAAHHAGGAPNVRGSIVTVPLNTLRHSDLNVRKTERAIGIPELARDIAENGLKQNLVVVAAATAGDGFEVIAGDRRLQAMQLLCDEGTLAADMPVPVLIEERATGRQTSLSENLHRVALNPADELVAFRTIIDELDGDEPARIAECARRFGRTVQYVEQRLRLADLHPDILEALRAGDITLESAKAYAGFDAHALQLLVFTAECRRQHGMRHDPKEVRYQLAAKTYPSNVPQALYVGLIAYRAAGGGTDRDLFMGVDDGRERLLHTVLLDRLAKEKAEAELPIRAKEDGFNFGVLQNGFYGDRSPWPKAPPGFVRSHAVALDDLPKRQRVKSIGVYGLAGDGSRLVCQGHFEPITTPGAVSLAARREWQELDEQHNAAERYRAVNLHAARLAVRRFTGLPSAENALWPGDFIEPIEEQADGTFLVAVQYRVTAAELEEMRAAAEQALDAELATAAAGDQLDG